MSNARYCNIHTARRLLLSLRRALDRFVPHHDAWPETADGRIDPFHRLIQPSGFASRDEPSRDRSQYIAAVRYAFATLDLPVFSLGLPKSGISAVEVSVYPACPGTTAEGFDPDRDWFHNPGVDEVVADLVALVTKLPKINPDARVPLTVSSVPLVATATDARVFQTTTYSKAVLHVAADTICRRFPETACFLACEIVTGVRTRGLYFDQDLRLVTEAGVDHVMALSSAHAADGESAPPAARTTAFPDRSQSAIDLLCEKARLDERLDRGA